MLKRLNVIFILEIIGLIILDQGVKIIINNSYLGAHIPLIEPFVYFSPIFNRDLSWIDSMLPFDMGQVFHITVVIVAIILIYFFYRYLIKRNVSGKIIDLAFSFVVAGAACSLFDKVFWPGSLDFVRLNGLFTFDLKDVYLNVFIGFLILLLIIDYKGIRKAIL